MSCIEPEVTYVYVILVDGTISNDGFFLEEEHEEALRVSKKYATQSVKLKKIKHYRRQVSS